MKNNKIFILLPDGVGLRNFAFTNFHKIGVENGFDITFWNNTPFDLSELGFKEIKIDKAKTHIFADIYKNARKHIELNLNIKKSHDVVYDTYRFPFNYKGINNKIKSYASRFLISNYSSEKGLKFIREKISKNEKTTTYYQKCVETLQEERPAIVFCTNQRPILAVAPILAAKQLGIPTATFIFSWDNLPKATMVVETDYYFVWSEHMKKELLNYYPYIEEKQVFISGTPQFETHFSSENLVSRELFFEQNKLDINKRYICYSGDDVTTCPDDSEYLKDVAEAVSKLNAEGENLGIIFRRCPVDFSNRYDKVLEEYKNSITPIAPEWKKISEGWNTILPTYNDVILQMNTIKHTEMVVNLGSSMVFDYVSYKKTCSFINYDVPDRKDKNWSVAKIYNYIHFRSMPNKEAVLWLNSPGEIAQKIKRGLEKPNETVQNAQKWFEIINQQPPESSSRRIWQAIEKIIN
ncbi:UDP-glycosyltransferase [Flavobacterium sp. MC2016-06]|uniref:UDP-glycosyltransferase n=1 Tax=Flavobacterium sp. MC2016-06 TaxID=2676308 RepID=UPI0012BACEB3|nr:UDP-glycosyltransferase [Flavobacterium sp. MC2016-06]MBU3858675.1 UDP-glycosyltransferase [Flavobacterium sp. MC2016-06]